MNRIVQSFTPSDITLYIPCFNVEKTLADCLAAVSKQTIKPHVVLLIDDGSKIPIRAADCAVIRHTENRGLAAARNTALNHCSTRLLAAVDADVAPAPDWLEALLEAMNSAPVVGIGGRVEEYYQVTLGDRWRSIHMAQHWGDALLWNPRFLYGANTLFQAGELRVAGGYDEKLRTNNEDRTMCEALYARGKALLYTPKAKCRHMRRDTCRSILPGYWRWHHAAGLQRGEFDSPAGLITRIQSVAFGIFQHRFELDWQAGRTELLGLDALLPWVFCACDLEFFSHRQSVDMPSFPNTTLFAKLPAYLQNVLQKCLPIKQSDKAMPWFNDYLSSFEKSLEISGWWRKAMKEEIWQPLNRELASA